MKTFWLILLMFCGLSLLSPTGAATLSPLSGINLAGAEFGGGIIPGKHGTNYLWPSAAEVNMYADAGFKILRIPFLWQRIQHELNSPLDETELARLDQVVEAGAKNKVQILLDVHNYGFYNKNMIGSDSVPTTAFNDLWSRLASHYRDQPHVMFGLMNEPYKHKADEWALIAQSAITAIRNTGAKQLILVPGTRWSGAHSWMAGDKNSNATALSTIHDPANNFIFEMHQYFDSDSSGTHDTCVSEDTGAQRLASATAWLRKTGNKALLGEFGASKDPTCLKALANTLKYMENNADVWYGWTYWAAGKWFGTYMFNVYPPDPEKFPQMKILTNKE